MAEGPSTARSIYVAPCGERVQGLDPLFHHKATCAECMGPEAYYALCDRARAHGIPTSLDDPETPQTVAALLFAVSEADAAAASAGLTAAIAEIGA